MNEKFEDAVAKVRALADERQQEAADLLIEYLQQKSPEIYLTPDQIVEMERSGSDDEPSTPDDDLRSVLSRLIK